MQGRTADAPDETGTVAVEGEPYSPEAAAGAEPCAATGERTNPESERLMEAVVERSNMESALKRVRRNAGAAGVDGMTTAELGDHLKRHWLSIKAALLDGRYIPQPVRRVDIPKPQGGERTLGIPTVTDRLIQQALHQVLQAIFEPGFSAHSYGFRPKRDAGQAVKAARAYIREGRTWVVDIDLESFFDRVNHDRLMARVARQVKDQRVLKLIRRYLEAGMMDGGVVSPRTEGTPQGGPLSPLLSNILLTDLDRELERRGHRFCRYADDCNIYVQTERAGQRTMAGLTRYLEERLKLKVNRAKSAVARPWGRKFLGYSFTADQETKLRLAQASRERFRDRIVAVLKANRGRSLTHVIEQLNPLLRGWMNYFRHLQTPSVLHTLDGGIRRKLRCILWRQWKRVISKARNLMRLGLEEVRAWRSATNGRGAWWNAGASHMNAATPKAWFDRLQLVSLVNTHRALQRAT